MSRLYVRAFRTAFEIDPNSALSHWHLGAALAQAGARRSDRLLQRSIHLDPSTHDARADLDAVKAASNIR